MHGFRATLSTTANASGLWDGDLAEARLSNAQSVVWAACGQTVCRARRRKMMQWHAGLLDALAERRNVNQQSKALEAPAIFYARH